MKLNRVGVDMSAKTFTVVIEHDGTKCEAFDLPNDAKGHKKLIRIITKKGFQARVVLEATGNYSLDLALALHRAPRVEVMVANPRAVSQFAGAYLRRSKTDAVDANVLVEFAQRMPFEPWKPPAGHAFDLRAISRRIEALTKTATQEKNRLHAADSFGEMTDVVRNDIEVNIRHLESRIERLREQARELIAEHAELERAFQHITSVKGIATAAGIQLLAELAMLPDDMDVRQWVAHAGMDPRQIQSGTSINRPARISRRGNAHLRRALFLPALVAVQHEPHVQAFYEKLLARGKTKMQANVAVMRKLLHSIHGMIKHDRDFEGEKFYALGA
ncbi:MAG: IS110 family transposase [Myxococcota bacterium]